MSAPDKKKSKKHLPIFKRNSKPRYWTSPFWSDNSVKDLLSEIIKPDQIDMSAIKVNDDLNPILWDGDELKSDIRQALLKIAFEFIKYCKIEDKKFTDIILVGSSANYNYTPQSDIDLHIVTDFTKIDTDAELIGEYFKVKKDMWTLEHNITFNDQPIECYVQDVNEPNVSTGVYSVIRNAWVKKPMKKFLSVDEPVVQMKVADIVNKIDSLITDFNAGTDVTAKSDAIKQKIKNMRKAGLYKEGEFSPENLAFKILRNTGYLDKLTKLKNDSFDKKLSVDNDKTANPNGNI